MSRVYDTRVREKADKQGTTEIHRRLGDALKNANCSIEGSDTIKFVRDIAKACGARHVTARAIEAHGHTFELTISTPQGSMLCDVMLRPNSLVVYNAQNQHLTLKIRDNGGEIPLVIEVISEEVEKNPESFRVSVFPAHLERLKRRSRLAAVA